MKKLLFKISFIFSIVLLFLTFSSKQEVNAAGMDKSNLEFKLVRVVNLGDSKIISIDVTNKSETTTYSFGWVSSCRINVKTTDGTYIKEVSNASNHKIIYGTKTHTFTMDAPGDIVSIHFTDIRELDSRGLPISHGVDDYVHADFNVDVNNYKIINGVNVLIVVAAALLGIFILIVTIRKRMINAEYNRRYNHSNNTRNSYRINDYQENHDDYSSRRINDEHQRFMRDMQRQQFDEQSRLFQEQSERHHQNFIDDSNQQFNNFNNFNN